MHPDCQTFRDALPEGGRFDPELLRAGHGASCAACAAWVGRAISALGDLPRRSAPAELEGRVVAALEAGFREDRAVAFFATLGRVAAPGEELEGAVARELERPPIERHGAPGVLERLVEEELADPAKARTRRFLGSLPRKPAPVELDARLEAAIRRETGAPTRVTLPRIVAGGLALAAAVTAVLVPVLMSPEASLETPSPRSYSFRVERIDSAASLDPVARALLDGLSGGLVSTERM